MARRAHIAYKVRRSQSTSPTLNRSPTLRPSFSAPVVRHLPPLLSLQVCRLPSPLPRPTLLRCFIRQWPLSRPPSTNRIFAASSHPPQLLYPGSHTTATTFTAVASAIRCPGLLCLVPPSSAALSRVTYNCHHLRRCHICHPPPASPLPVSTCQYGY